MINYNICFIRRGNEVLLLNRNFQPWMGCWNGVGGKLEANELPRDSVIREIYEETNIQEYDLQFKGLITWTIDGNNFGGMFLYVAQVHDEFLYETPIKTDEGLLDWKPIHWVSDRNNSGIAANVPRSIEMILNDPDCYIHHCTYVEGELVEHTSNKIHPGYEMNEELREQYLASLGNQVVLVEELKSHYKDNKLHNEDIVMEVRNKPMIRRASKHES